MHLFLSNYYAGVYADLFLSWVSRVGEEFFEDLDEGRSIGKIGGRWGLLLG